MCFREWLFPTKNENWLNGIRTREVGFCNQVTLHCATAAHTLKQINKCFTDILIQR